METASWGIEMAGLLHDLIPNEDTSLGITMGEVISLSPLKISLFQGSIIISADIHTIYAPDIIELKEEEIDFLSNLENGDKVSVMADNTNQEFYILYKLKKVGG